MSSYRYSHWFWFFVLLAIFSAFDYFEHISRTGSLFSKHPSEWLLFSFASSITVGFTLYFGANLLNALKINALVADLSAFVLAMVLHLSLTGSLWNKLLWPHSKLIFHLDLQMAGTFLLGYILYRILFIIIISLVKRFVDS